MCGGKCVCGAAPDTGPPPADKTVVASRVRAEVIWQIAPWCARSQDPEDTIEDTSVVYSKNPRGLFGSMGLMATPS